VARIRLARLDRIADALEQHLDVDAVFGLITSAELPPDQGVGLGPLPMVR
jgi:hypothetical protein